jgi:hypothetical protein
MWSSETFPDSGTVSVRRQKHRLQCASEACFSQGQNQAHKAFDPFNCVDTVNSKR